MPCQILRILAQKRNGAAVACCSDSWDVGTLFLVVRDLLMLLGVDTIHVCKDAESCSYRRVCFYCSRCENSFRDIRERLRIFHREKKVIFKTEAGIFFFKGSTLICGIKEPTKKEILPL